MTLEELKALSGIIGLGIFVSFFAVMLWWVFRPGAKKHHEENAQIPLKED